MSQPRRDLGRVQLDALDREAPLTFKPIEKLAARQVVDHHVELALALEGEVHACEERVADVLEDDWPHTVPRWRSSTVPRVCVRWSQESKWDLQPIPMTQYLLLDVYCKA